MIPATWMSQIAAQKRVSARIAPIPATGSGSFQYGMSMATTNWPIELRMAAGAASRQRIVRSISECSARSGLPRIDDNPGFRR